MKYDVCALGELLVDFTESGKSPAGNPTFEANPGGAPCNVLAMLNNLGKRTAFIGKVGADAFGRELCVSLDEVGTDTRGLISDSRYNTTLAFVHTHPDGDREFSFYRNMGADTMLAADEVDAGIIKSSRVFHFGTLSSTHPTSREATRFALDTARENGVIISFDPNLRENLWESLDNARAEILYGFAQCNILKISDYELEFLYGTGIDYDTAMLGLMQEYKNIKIAFLTCGKRGANAYYNGAVVHSDAFLEIKAVDTTGAGDTFTGCVLSYLLEHGVDTLTSDNLRQMLDFANAAASLVTAKKGAMKSMPSRDEVYALAAGRN